MLGDTVEKIKYVILKPSIFFEKIKYEKDIWSSFKYFALVSLATLVGGLLISFVGSSPISMITALVPGLASLVTFSAVLLSVVVYIILLFGTFVSAGIIHIIAKLFGGRGDYTSTYKALVYASTPSMLLGWIPIVGIITNLYSFYLGIVGISKLHSVSMLRSILIVIAIPMILTTIVAGLMFLYISSSFTFMAAA